MKAFASIFTAFAATMVDYNSQAISEDVTKDYTTLLEQDRQSYKEAKDLFNKWLMNVKKFTGL